MKVLFISSGNSKAGISPIIKNQGESLRKQGVELEYFTIKGKGIKGYLKNIKPLKQFLKQNQFDIVHAHYSLVALVAILAGAKPIVVSFMGDDVLGSQRDDGSFMLYGKFIVSVSKIVNRLVSFSIVKSKEMQDKMPNAEIIANGVDFNKYKPLDKKFSCKKINKDEKSNYILFPANPNRQEKNYNLFQNAVSLINKEFIETMYYDNTPNEYTPFYYNAASVVVLTSYHEGSPNVIKEAMACNIPIVSTDVGDVREVIGKTKACYITSFEPEDVADKIKKALAFGKRTTGREDIKHLESSVVAKRIIAIYKKVLDKK